MGDFVCAVGGQELRDLGQERVSKAAGLAHLVEHLRKHAQHS